MRCLSTILERIIKDETSIVIVGEDKKGIHKRIFNGSALDAYRHRNQELKRCWNYDVLSIEPCAVKVDGENSMALKITVYFEYGYKE